MSIEEIIKELGEMEGFCLPGVPLRVALHEAIALLRTHPAVQPNEPLTNAQLKHMDGEAVFCVPKAKVTGYMGIVAASEASIVCRSGFVPFYLFRAIYRRPPKEVEER